MTEQVQAQERNIRIRFPVPIPKVLQGPVTRIVRWLHDEEELNLSLDLRRLLPAPSQTSGSNNGPQPLTIEERLESAKELLGVEFCRAGRQARVKVVNPHSAWDPDYGFFDRDERGVGLLPANFDLLQAWRSGAPWMSLLMPGVEVGTDEFETTIGKARGLLNSETYHDLLDATRKWLLPDIGLLGFDQRVIRTGVLWVPEPWASGSGMRVASALEDAEPVDVDDIGRVTWSTLMDRFATRSEVTPGVNSQLMGAPSSVCFENGVYRLGSSQQVTGIWNIVPRYDMIDDLMGTRSTLLWMLYNRSGHLWCNAFVRATRSSREKLAQFEADLARFCAKVQAIPGFDLFGRDTRWLFQAFVPGGTIPPDLNGFQVEPDVWFLETLASHIRTAEPGGSIPLGVTPIGGLPVLLDWRFSTLIEGGSNSGKTTLVEWMMLTGTPFVVVVHVSSVPGESGPVWSRDMTGQCWNIDHLTAAKGPEHFRDLVIQDKEDIVKKVAEMEARWLHWQYPFDLPLVIRLDTQSDGIPQGEMLCPYRYARYANNFIQVFAEAWGRFTRLYPQFQAALCVDDVAGWLFRNPDPVIRDEAVHAGGAVRENLLWWVNHLRKLGFRQFKLTIHDLEEMLRFPEGALGDFGYALRLPLSVKHSRVYAYEPKAMLVKDPQPDYAKKQGFLEVANCRLPARVLQVVARTTDRPKYFV